MKQKKALIFLAALAAAATLLLIFLPSADNLWVAYICFLTAIAMMLAGVLYVAKRKIPGGFVRLGRRIWILPASLVISIAVLVLQYGGIFYLPFEMHIVAQLAVLAVGAVKLMEIGTPKKLVAKKPKTTSKEKKTPENEPVLEKKE